MTMPLLESTGNPTADKILQGVIGIVDVAFPDRVRGVQDPDLRWAVEATLDRYPAPADRIVGEE